jgi:hypothetical protein
VENATTIDEATGDGGASHLPQRDFSLKEGEKIHVAVKIHSKKSASSKPSSGGGGLLRPPPPAGSIVKSAVEPTVDLSAIETPQGGEVDDDSADWGDFTSS